ncbi:MAG: hypothetical protein J7599_11930 [Niabella sp.]|nr:hypothetical protein [Niabella sp.]
MKFNLRSRSLKTILSVLAALTLVFIFMGAGSKKSKLVKLRENWGGAVFTYSPATPSFAPADVANPNNWHVTYRRCQFNYPRYACTFQIAAPEDSMTYYTDFVTALSRLRIETSNTDTAYVTGVFDSLYPDAPMDVDLSNGYSPYGD